MLMIYAKHKNGKTFRPMDMTEGVPVKNKIYATVYGDDQRDRLNHLLTELHEENKDWKFEIRHTN